MPKKRTDYPEQINILTVKGTTENLIAISYYRGDKGYYAGPAKDFIADGIKRFIESLTPKERKRFDEILENVRIMKGQLP
jgi:hypothetical protein